MISRFTVIFLLLICPSLSFILDPAMEDGVYEINFNVQNYWLSDDRHRNIMAYYDPSTFLNRTVTSKKPILSPGLPITHYQCKSQIKDPKFAASGNLLKNKESTRAARDMLANWCEMFNLHQKGGLVVAIVEQQAWYMCNWDFKIVEPGGQRCSRKEILWAEEMMDGLCGYDMVSHVHMRPWLKDYGRAVQPGIICGVMETWPPQWPKHRYFDIIKGMKKIDHPPEKPWGNAYPEVCDVSCGYDEKCRLLCAKEELKKWEEQLMRTRKWKPGIVGQSGDVDREGPIGGSIRENNLGKGAGDKAWEGVDRGGQQSAEWNIRFLNESSKS